MKQTLFAFALAAFASIVPAHADVLVVNFTGTVYQTVGATGQTVGSTVTGHFDLNAGSGNFLDFTIAGKSVAAGFLSTANFSTGGFDSIYTAQVSPVALGTPSNSSFTLDLSALSNWPSTDTPFTLLTDKTQLATNLDTITNPASAFPSTFNYYTANSNGTNVVSMAADLTSITATDVPEPASLALIASSLLALGAFARRRSA